MLAIHEHSKRLQTERDRAGANVTTNGEDEINEQTMKTAKKIGFIILTSESEAHTLIGIADSR